MGILDRLFRGGARRGEGDVSPELDALFTKLYRFMSDEAFQNQALGYSPELLELMTAGGGVDEIPGAIGDFGREYGNPIPVNGPVGELVYISNLTLENGCHVMGHRLGSVERTDVFETVTLDGSRWDILFFDFCHTRKSRRLPAGYRVGRRPEGFLLATNFFVPDFPEGIHDAMTECTERFIGGALVSPQLQNTRLFRGFARPPGHMRSLEALPTGGGTQSCGDAPAPPAAGTDADATTLVIGRDISWAEIIALVFRVRDFDRAGTTIGPRNEVRSRSATEPYGYLLVESPMLHHAVTLPITHRDDFLLASSVFDEPALADAVTDAELLVTYVPEHNLPGGMAGIKHALHYVIVPPGTLDRYYEVRGCIHMSEPAPQKLFGRFAYAGELRVKVNEDPQF